MKRNDYELNEKIHAIIINPYLSVGNLRENCDLIKKYNIKNVSTSLNFLKFLRDTMNNQKITINALISYPLADLPINFIDEFICYSKEMGANGIEYVPNFLNLSKNKIDHFAVEIERIKKSELPVTIVINKTKLDKEIFKKAVEISLEIGIRNFQFGDGFGSPITSLDITEIIDLIGNKTLFKIVGGVNKLSQVIDLFDKGVNFIGTSNFHNIFQEIRQN